MKRWGKGPSGLTWHPDRHEPSRQSKMGEVYQSPTWNRVTPGTIEVRVYLEPEQDGGYSVWLPSLPGVVSQGETEEEALRHIEEAFRGAAEVYREEGRPVPWTDEPEPRPSQAEERRILVNV
jgi:antitoxin HicB